MEFKKLIMGALATLSLAVGTASAQSADMSAEAIAERLAPVGELCLVGEECGGAAPAAAASGGGAGAGAGQSGEEIYASVCMACHDTGAAGAPKRGDAAAWEARMAKGMETLYTHAIEGFKAMPAKGGNPSLSDQDVKRSVNYLTEPVRSDDVAIDTGSDAGDAAPADAAATNGEAAPAEGGTEVAAADAAAADAAAAGGGEESSGDSGIDGAAIYAQVCTACHATGVAGAPKRGDAAAWSPRLEKGMETLYSSAINGLGVMPPKGGNPNLSDAEVKAAVDHLLAPVQ